jgi:hypothetical protein
MRRDGALLSNLAPVRPDGFCVVIARAAEQLDSELLLNFRSPVVASRFKPKAFAARTPCIRATVSLLRRPEKPNWNASAQGFGNVLANERLFLPIVDVAVDLLRFAHGETITQNTHMSGKRCVNQLTALRPSQSPIYAHGRRGAACSSSTESEGTGLDKAPSIHATV